VVGHLGAIRKLLAQHGHLSVSAGDLGADTDLYQAGITSLATVNFMLALENHFDIEFPDALLSRKTFASLQSIAQAVEELAGRPTHTRPRKQAHARPASRRRGAFPL
jgi:acyl carrier protein